MRFFGIVAASAILALSGCDSPQSSKGSEPSPDASSTPEAPRHNWAEHRKGAYYYITAVSDDDAKTGKAVGDVVGFRYLGQNSDGDYVLQSVNDYGSGLKVYCSQPCAIVRYSNGEKIGFNPESIIGAAFTDAFNGQLEESKGR